MKLLRDAEAVHIEKLRKDLSAATTARDVALAVYEKAMSLIFAEFDEGDWTIKSGWTGKSKGDA